MRATSHQFKQNVSVALEDIQLQQALTRVQDGFVGTRASAVGRLPEFEQIRAEAKAIKEHTLTHLDYYLDQFERKVLASGGQVHWARTAQEACAAVLEIIGGTGKQVLKGKSMVSEEIGLNAAMERTNRKLYFGEKFTLSIREGLPDEEQRGLLTRPGVLFARD